MSRVHTVGKREEKWYGREPGKVVAGGKGKGKRNKVEREGEGGGGCGG